MEMIVYIFILVWLVVTLIGFWKPKSLMRTFPSMTKVFGIHHDTVSPGGLIFYRTMHAFFFLFCLYVLVLMLNGKVQF